MSFKARDRDGTLRLAFEASLQRGTRNARVKTRHAKIKKTLDFSLRLLACDKPESQRVIWMCKAVKITRKVQKASVFQPLLNSVRVATTRSGSGFLEFIIVVLDANVGTRQRLPTLTPRRMSIR